jgi:N-acetylmuramoyl-L-alanine amidase
MYPSVLAASSSISALASFIYRHLVIALLLAAALPARAGELQRVELESNVQASVKDGRRLSLEVRPPRGAPGKALLQKYLAEDSNWKVYEGKGMVAIPYERLNSRARREVLLAVYGEDVIDERGWLHTVIQHHEDLATLCEWITGRSADHRRVMQDNGLQSPELTPGMAVLIAADLLPEVMKQFTPRRAPQRENGDSETVDYKVVGAQLSYGEDGQGQYAAYRLKKGEALYTAVVVQFTDFQDHTGVMEGVEIILKRNNIRDPRDIAVGTDVRIPFDILSARYLPHGTEEREAFEEVVRVAQALKHDRVRTRDLEGVVVILDPGHGIFDTGAVNHALGLYEDEINYDIACRIKKILESQTEARVYMTLEDISQGFEPTDARRFVHDTDERILTSPPYAPRKEQYDNKISLNLRWMLANAIYHNEVNAGADSRKIVFTSIHTDALYSGIRGAMVYVPGAAHRRRHEQPRHVEYARYAEGRDFGNFSCSDAEMRRDEAMSLNFAQILLDELGKKRIKRHDKSDPIRNHIRSNRNNAFVPAVLRNTKAPIKVLVETANINNRTDCERLADPQWRQWFAEAYVNALKSYFGS